MADIIITHCTRDHVQTMVKDREKGWSYERIARKHGFHKAQVTRYIRLFYLYGPKAFVEQEAAA